MTKFLLIFTLVFAAFAALPVFAQDPPPKNVIAVTAAAERSSVNLQDIQNETRGIDVDRDSVGFNFEYTRFLGDSPVGVGFSTGATFHNKPRTGEYSCGPNCVATRTGTSTVANAWWLYKMYLQDRKGTFQPFVHGDIGGQNGNLGGVAFGPTGAVQDGPGHQFVYGFGGGADLCFGEKKSKCLRGGVTATRAFNSNSNQWNLRGEVGLAIKFGKK